jgi:hypothetical protein
LRDRDQGEAFTLQALATVDTQTVVPPLKTDPMTVGPIATAAPPTGAPTNGNGAGVKAGRAGSAGKAGSAGVAALASASGAAIASALITPTTETARVLIPLKRLLAAIDFSW